MLLHTRLRNIAKIAPQARLSNFVAGVASVTPKGIKMNTQSLPKNVQEAHQDAQNLIDWLSISGVAERYNLEVGYLIGMLKMCIHSCTTEEAVGDIYLLADYIKGAVGT